MDDLTGDLFGFERKPKKRKDSETWQRLLLFANMWQEKYEERYVIVWGFDGKQMLELKDVEMDVITERLVVYFADDWYGNCKHSVQAFVKNFNKFIVPRKAVRSTMQNNMTIICADCGSVHRVSEDCPKPDCPTNAWKKATLKEVEDAQKMLNGLVGHFTLPKKGEDK